MIREAQGLLFPPFFHFSFETSIYILSFVRSLVHCLCASCFLAFSIHVLIPLSIRLELFMQHVAIFLLPLFQVISGLAP